jgi:ribonuclease Z
MKQRLIFCGTGGYHPNERRHTASLLLPNCGVALDAGTGFFRVPERLTGPHLDVFLTHAHLDHVCGLTFILVPMIREQITRVRVFGTSATLDTVRTHLLANALFPVVPDFEWHVLDGPVTLEDGGQLSWRPLEHPGGSVGYRIDWDGCSMAYITDTTAPGKYTDFIRNVDLLVHECYFADDMHEWAVKTGHSSSTPVAELAHNAGVGRLVLVHMDPETDLEDPVGLPQIRRIFPRSDLATDLLELQF